MPRMRMTTYQNIPWTIKVAIMGELRNWPKEDKRFRERSMQDRLRIAYNKLVGTAG